MTLFDMLLICSGAMEPRCYEDMPCWNPATMGNGIGEIK